ncbi:MAG: HlyD family efflux transporter periplasmic adaptor subunit [Bacteroidales bacterium]|nr:HlyD family efflux transporter periplasmic adaptor subunit [Bacteroidales bacterium]
MKKVYYIALITFLILAVTACSGRRKKADAYGSFEASELLISAQAEGQLLDFGVAIGSKIPAGTYIAAVDSTQLLLQREQLESQMNAFWAQYSIIPKKYKEWQDSLVAVEQLLSVITEKARDNQSLTDSVETCKVLKQHLIDTIAAWQDKQSAQLQALVAQASQMYVQLRQLNTAIAKCNIVSPISGTLLCKYVNQYELVGKGYPIAKMADLDEMTLKVFVSEKQLADIHLGDTCTVRIDKGKKDLKQYTGDIIWISDQSEFTPKMIQTKDERVNLVYAIKITVKNDGSIKIGMPGEAKFKATDDGKKKRNRHKKSK